MFASIMSGAVLGIDAYPVRVEVDIASGLPSLSIVGLPDLAVKESKDRVAAAIKNSGFEFPTRKITINLAPAGMKKEEALFDLPIALGILAATGQVKTDRLNQLTILGELSLDGKITRVKGVLPITLASVRENIPGIILPSDNCSEAAVVKGIRVYPVNHLKETVQFLNGEVSIQPREVEPGKLFERNAIYDLDFNDVKGQEFAKRALEVAAAGGHNLLMIGPPGAGKTMLARRLPTILPDLTLQEAIETTKIHSVSGLVSPDRGLIATRPFRSPHHTISDIALVGGGSFPHPGEVSLSHNGVLFLDELPEFHRSVLEVLRQPLEDGVVSIARATTSVSFPAKFMLSAAMNPCPCGFYGHPNRECTCTTFQIQKYRAKISGPLLDRIDIQIEVPALRYQELSQQSTGESSKTIRQRVNEARQIQQERFKDYKTIHCNAHMQTKQIKKFCKITSDSENLLENAIERLGLSARAYDRILKIARTIADLEHQEAISSAHIAESIQYRSLDRNLWA